MPLMASPTIAMPRYSHLHALPRANMPTVFCDDILMNSQPSRKHE